MPLIIYLNGGLRATVEGDNIYSWVKPFKRNVMMMCKSVDGRPMLVRSKDVVLVEHLPQETFDSMREEQKKIAEQQQGQKLTRPNLIIPKRQH